MFGGCYSAHLWPAARASPHAAVWPQLRCWGRTTEGQLGIPYDLTTFYIGQEELASAAGRVPLAVPPLFTKAGYFTTCLVNTQWQVWVRLTALALLAFIF